MTALRRIASVAVLSVVAAAGSLVIAGTAQAADATPDGLVISTHAVTPDGLVISTHAVTPDGLVISTH
ncbi:hypothetical protein P3T35_005989 [Kitasatospora sp. GP30]|uniref:hypothetical protein n=1 Tax=Kitasatospora sp. GP30 TaxID=3035084 RepID=UPI000C7124D3|nr:hypothetical protein [Kitasatospora sp. GP30]MDH6143954.1 hypothetical protein [Kitasatospora sp. GP30]